MILNLKRKGGETMNKKLLSVHVFVFTFFAVAFRSSAAWAITAPTAGAFLYPMYDIFVTKMAGGAAMFTVGVAGIIVGGYYLFHSEYGKSIGAIVATGIMIAAPSIVTTLGMTF